MSNYQLFKAAFTKPLVLIHSIQQKWRTVIVYLLFLSLISSFGPIIRSLNTFESIQQAGHNIAEKLPDFHIENNHLVTEKDTNGFIYMTDHLIFTFDPQGKRHKKDIEADILGTAIAVAFLQKEILIVLPAINNTTNLMESNVVHLPYSSFETSTLDRNFIVSLFDQSYFHIVTAVVSIIMTLWSAFCSLLLNLIILSLVTSAYCRLTLKKLRFKDNLKLLTYCSTIPIVFSTLTVMLLPHFSPYTAALALTLIIYFNLFKQPKTDQ